LRDHREALEQLQSFDLAIYQIGNYWEFHGQIMLTALEHPGIVVLHDYTIQHLMAAYCFEHLSDPDAYFRFMKASHGEEAAREVTAALLNQRPQIWETDDAILYPLTPVVTKNAIGVVAHSQYALGGLRTHYDGPAAVLPLPYRNEQVPAAEVSAENIGISPEDLLVITAGHMNPNKLVHKVIAALATLPAGLQDRLVYALLGPVDDWYRNRLTEAAVTAGVANRVRIEGYVSDARLLAYLNRADLCINLRSPNFEGASASVIEQLIAGKAVVVSDTGSFAELPSDVVCRITDENDLPRSLGKLLASRDERAAMASAAFRYARATYRADSYAAALSVFAVEVLQESPVRHLQNAITHYAQGCGLTHNDEWLRGVHDLVRNLFLGR
jgi:glycosyltransferase involved in cell wall biosynthesis